MNGRLPGSRLRDSRRFPERMSNIWLIGYDFQFLLNKEEELSSKSITLSLSLSLDIGDALH